MSGSPKTGGLDVTGLVLVASLAAISAAAGVALNYYCRLSPLELALWLVICVAFVIVGLPHHGPTGPRNSFVHGAARPAVPDEIQKAARGANTTPGLHDQHFSD